MTAEEIRKSLFEFQQLIQDAVKEDAKAAMQSVPAAAIGKIPLYLGEIAAQLAELNATLKARPHSQPVVYVRDGGLGE